MHVHELIFSTVVNSSENKFFCILLDWLYLSYKWQHLMVSLQKNGGGVPHLVKFWTTRLTCTQRGPRTHGLFLLVRETAFCCLYPELQNMWTSGFSSVLFGNICMACRVDKEIDSWHRWHLTPVEHMRAAVSVPRMTSCGRTTRVCSGLRCCRCHHCGPTTHARSSLRHRGWHHTAEEHVRPGVYGIVEDNLQP